MEKERYYRLEYHESRRQWHHDNFTHEPNTFGWITIAKKETDKKITTFCNLVDEFYKNKWFLNYEIIVLWKFFDKIYKP